jgi:tight adherence protein C
MNNIITVIIIFFLLLLSITMFILAFAKPKQQEDINVRLEKLRTTQAGAAPRPEKYGKVSQEFNQVIKRVAPLAERLINPNLEENYRAKLIKAGKYQTDVITFISTCIVSAVAFPLIFVFLNYLFFDTSFEETFYAVTVMALLGFLYPLARLNRQVADRHKAIFRELPDILDLLTVCLEAGMGINEALTKVVEKSRPGALREEIDRTLREIQLGNPRLQALRTMAKRIDLKELSSVIVAIVQAEQMGTSLAKTLKIQSEIIREMRWQKAQEQAQKAPVKLIIPVALFIFPTIFIVIFGPLVISFIIGNQ